MDPLRIAVWHNLPSGGGKRQLYNHVVGLVGRGHHVESWCPDTADQKHLPLGDVVPEHVVPLDHTSDLFHAGVRPLGVTRQLLAAMDRHCATCAKAIGDGGFDLLFANACMFLRTTPIARFVTLPSALYLGEPYRWIYEAMPELPWIAPTAALDRPRSWTAIRDWAGRRSGLNSIRLQARAELEYLRAFDMVLANSMFSRETLLRTYNIESSVCYLGVDTARYRPSGEPRERLLVGLGTIYHGKGVDRAIRAVAAIEASRRPPLVWVANAAWPEALAAYQRLAARLGVEFTARIDISDADVVSLLSRATALICTSRLEPFGLAPLEANACGTPVVAIAEGGIRETIEDGVNGLLVAEDDPRALADRIVRLVDDAALVERLGEAARARVVSRWNLERCTDNIESMLRRLQQAHAATALVSQKHRLREFQPTDNIRFNIERRSVRNGAIDIAGWAYIDDGRDATGSRIFIVLRNASDMQLIRARRVLRPDVTRHFGAGDYDDSGFAASAVVDLGRAYDVGILIVRGSDIALHLIP